MRTALAFIALHLLSLSCPVIEVRLVRSRIFARTSTISRTSRYLFYVTVALLILLFAGVSCARVVLSETVFPGVSWEHQLPEEVGMHSAKLRQFTNAIGGSGVVIREGYLVASWGGNTYGEWASASKPVYSTLMFFASTDCTVVRAGRISMPRFAKNSA